MARNDHYGISHHPSDHEQHPARKRFTAQYPENYKGYRRFGTGEPVERRRGGGGHSGGPGGPRGQGHQEKLGEEKYREQWQEAAGAVWAGEAATKG